MIAVVTFLWGTRYDARYVNRLYDGLKKQTGQKFEFYCFIDRAQPGLYSAIRRQPLWEKHGELGRCYRRLRMYSKDIVNLIPADRILMIDLDTVIVGNMTPLLMINEPFAIWRAASVGEHEYCLNPSFVSMVPGIVSYIYEAFAANPKQAISVAQNAGWTGSDQAILSFSLSTDKTRVKLLDQQDGLYSYRDDDCTPLPANARLVSFYGDGDPAHNYVQNDAPWIKEHWL